MVSQARTLSLLLTILLVLTAGFAARGPHSPDGRVIATPEEPGADSTHTIIVPISSEMTGYWNHLELFYGAEGVFDRVTEADIVRVSVDRGGDDPLDDRIDDDLASRVRTIHINGDNLVVRLIDSVTLNEGDEVVITIRNVTNPPERTVTPVSLYVDAPERSSQHRIVPLEIGPDRPFLSVNNVSVRDLVNPDRFEVDDAKPVVYTPDGGFVVADVVHDGQTVRRAGHSEYLSPGAHTYVPIQVGLPVHDDDRVVVTLYADTNDNGRFDNADQPVTHNGTPVRASAGIDVIENVHRDTTTSPTTTTTSTTTTVAASPDGQTESRSTTAVPSPTAQPTPGFTIVTILVTLVLVLIARRIAHR